MARPISTEQIVAMATFAAVVEAKSFTEAARVMSVSKSVVSGRVAKLEEQLGVRLILRTTRRFALTSDGVRLYEKCARVVTAADEAAQTVANVSDAPVGVLRVHAPLAFAQARLARVLSELTRMYPGLRLDLRLDDRTPDLAKEGLDVAIVLAERLSETWLTAKKLAADRLVPCAAPGYLRRRGIPFRPQDLVHHARIAREPWDLTTDEGPLRLSEGAELTVDSTAFMRDAALAEVGIALLPASIIADDLARGALRVLFGGEHDRALGIYAVHLHERFVPARIRVFIDFLSATFKPGRAPKAVRPRASRARSGRRIPMTAQDVQRLTEVAAIYKDVDPPGVARLERALESTELVAPEAMPPTVVTMNSRCAVRDRSGKEREAALVYPWDAGDTRVSVLSAVGEAMLGAPVGAALPSGARLTAIRYQPEAAGDHHL
jgi:DNA-binding transcriptional LysR family regulator